MSIETWTTEFYSSIGDCPKEDAIEHSLKKWLGLRTETLKAHNLLVNIAASLCEPETENTFGIDANTCALCHWYYDSEWESFEHECAPCPIYKLRNASCDCANNDAKTSPYTQWTQASNPEPMIELLAEALRQEQPDNPLLKEV